MDTLTLEEFKQGELVIVDAGRVNSCMVKVLYQSPSKIFTRVVDERDGYQWTVMTYRLTKEKQSQ